MNTYPAAVGHRVKQPRLVSSPFHAPAALPSSPPGPLHGCGLPVVGSNNWTACWRRQTAEEPTLRRSTSEPRASMAGAARGWDEGALVQLRAAVRECRLENRTQQATMLADKLVRGRPARNATHSAPTFGARAVSH